MLSRSNTVGIAVFFIICLFLLSIRISHDISVEIAKIKSSANPSCFQFLNTLSQPLTESGEFLDMYLIDTKAIRKLKNNCNACLDLPISVMINESDANAAIDNRIYNVSYFTDKGEYIMIKSKPERVLLKQDNQRIGPLLVPVDLKRFLDYYERSLLIPCLNMNMNRNDTKSALPINFENQLAELRDELIEMGTMPFLTSGTFLGWYRECGIIPHTLDADFAVLRQEHRSNMLEHLKRLPGFNLYRRIGREFDSLELTVTAKGGGGIDIFIVYDEDDDHEYIHGCDLGSRKRYKWITPRAKGYCSGILKSRLFFVACNVEEILTMMYGKNWKIDHPTSKFVWNASPADTKVFGKFTEEEMKKYYKLYY